MKYVCEGCRTPYDSEGEARKCEDQEEQRHIAEVGDIVLVGAGFGWFNGDKRWISNPGVKLAGHKDHGNCFGKCCTYEFYYVVTFIDIEDHRVRYHVATKALYYEIRDREPRNGYTFNEGHHTPLKVKNPPKRVVADSRDLLGVQATWLI